MLQSIFLNEALTRSGYTQKELSEKSGIPTGTLGKLFAGTPGATISVDYLVRLSVALDFSLDDYAAAVHGVAPRASSSAPEQTAMLAQMHGWVKSEIGKYAEIPESFWTRLLDGISETFRKVEKERVVVMHMKREQRHNVAHIVSVLLILLSFFYFYIDASHHDWGLIQYEIPTASPTISAPVPSPTPAPPEFE